MTDSALDVTLKHLKAQIDKIASAVLGDPSDPQKPGHGLRLDRLEQTNKRQGRLLLTLGGGIVTILVSITIAIVLRVV